MTGALLYVTTYPDPDVSVEQYHSWYLINQDGGGIN
jgi:hypothetical protein